MVNTTDLMISCADEDTIVGRISKQTGINFKKISSSRLCGGHKVVIFKSYAACYRCIGEEKINGIITAFKAENWDCPELAVLIIDDDNGAFSGIVSVNQ